MMDTVLNLGITSETLPGLIALGGERFAYDAYRRLLQMFGKTVLGIEAEAFEREIQALKKERGVRYDVELTAGDLKELSKMFLRIIEEKSGAPFPDDPWEQLEWSIAAVFESWMGKRAVDYRTFYKIPHDLGTAANVVAMVFGNVSGDSGSGVAFTRDPATGEKRMYGEYLLNAQGEDVVAGIRTPQPIERLKDEIPEAYDALASICEKLEHHYREMQDVEFTIERRVLWMLQTRAGKRTAQAAIKIAVDFVKEGLIERTEAVMRVEPQQVEVLLHPRFDESAKEEARKRGDLLTKGLNASPGAAVGQAAFDADTAEQWGHEGKPVILVRPETIPDDVHGMLQSKGILTQRGGATSHAAVVARGLGLPAVVGCEVLQIDLERRQFTVNGVTINEGDWLSIDGATGEVFKEQLPTHAPQLEEQHELLELLQWADEFRKLGVRANADYPRDAERSRQLGAEGIGLCRTEHMFFEEDRLPIVRQMILARSKEEREGALEKLLPLQREDFQGILKAMAGYPVVIRLIDPPLHEFLPRYEELLVEVAERRARGEDSPELRERERLLEAVEAMREANPMLGLRGVRLGILYPEIVVMQVRAIFEAACRLKREGVDVRPEVMIPLVAHPGELRVMRDAIENVAREVIEGVEVRYHFGTMIEIPRACVVADEVAEYAEFFSFGTNDLTQTVFGISRDDAEGKFLVQYLEKGILADNPFQTLDRVGVGQLMKIAVEKGRAAREDLELGICGEHGGDPRSIEFCHQIGLDYVSCSPFRVPVARLAAAQAALHTQTLGREGGQKVT